MARQEDLQTLDRSIETHAWSAALFGG
jgi:hypothetical protein